MKFLSIDIEATGLDPATDQILEIAAVGGDTEDLSWQPIFHKRIVWTRLSGNPIALSMNAGLIKEMADHMARHSDAPNQDGWIFPTELWPTFESFWQSNGGVKNVAGKNPAGFGIPFLRAHDARFGGVFRHRVLDPAILCWRPQDDRLPDLATCFTRTNGEHPSGLHTAIVDAQMVRSIILAKLVPKK